MTPYAPEELMLRPYRPTSAEYAFQQARLLEYKTCAPIIEKIVQLRQKFTTPILIMPEGKVTSEWSNASAEKLYAQYEEHLRLMRCAIWNRNPDGSRKDIHVA